MKRPLLRTIVKPLYLAWASAEMQQQPKPEWYTKQITKDTAQNLVLRLPEHYRTQIQRFKKTVAFAERHSFFQRVMLAERVKASPRVLENFIQHLTPGIGFQGKASVPSDEPTCGTTFLGGCPDLPPGQEWPENQDGPMRFLGQFNFADVSAYDLENVLPKQGLIQFFVGAGDLPSGFEMDDKSCFRVLFHEEVEGLIRNSAPSHGQLAESPPSGQSRPLSPYVRWMIPTEDILGQMSLGLFSKDDESEDDGDEEEPWTEEHVAAQWIDHMFSYPFTPVGLSQLLGCANGLYGTNDEYVRLLCAAMAEGDEELAEDIDEDHPEWGRLSIVAKKWRCLFEIGSDRELFGVSWGDGGTLAFFIQEDDLSARRFDRCWAHWSTS
ncbi:DUF1963 domain-containing protein [Algisphaera agarilytica]|uniref:DUF1963 domain-containing protein n=1 Tax=Algisphaera agarilytica TaxID=1385975 RepID=A0A7X0HC37_9BACT|nr:YwqG family protein [Algisphaera agarilytica]MBB6431679.1 hypothetical protein [Algisphaera agarilytica]